MLLSWALPRGLPWDPGRNHLAVHTEDHPLEYLDFQGDIPEGSYGAGDMTVWDTGTYEPEKFDRHEARRSSCTASGRRAATPCSGPDGRDWMIHRMDPPVDPTRRHVPERFDLLDPVPGAPPDGDGWAIETRWHGIRCVLVSSGGIVDLRTRDGNGIDPWIPEVRPVGRVAGIHRGGDRRRADGARRRRRAAAPPVRRRVRFDPAAPGPRPACGLRRRRPAVA